MTAATTLSREHQRRLAGLHPQTVLYLLGDDAGFAWWRTGMQGGSYNHEEWHGTYETRGKGVSFREWGQQEPETLIPWRAIREHRAALPVAVVEEADALQAAITRNAVAEHDLPHWQRNPETGDLTDPAARQRAACHAEGRELSRQRAALVVRLLPLSDPEAEAAEQLALF